MIVKQFLFHYRLITVKVLAIIEQFIVLYVGNIDRTDFVYEKTKKAVVKKLTIEEEIIEQTEIINVFTRKVLNELNNYD